MVSVYFRNVRLEQLNLTVFSTIVFSDRNFVSSSCEECLICFLFQETLEMFVG